MKPNLDTFACSPFGARAFRCRMAALIASVAISACTTVRLDAVVFDAFDDPALSATLWQSWTWNGTGARTVANGHVRLGLTPLPYQPAFNNLMSRRTWTLQEGRRLEFRADLLSSNCDGALAFFGFYLNDGNRGYHILVDGDTVALHKRNSPEQLFFLTNGAPVKVSNVKLVLSMTGTNSGVLLQFKVLDNDNSGSVICEREYLDTAAVDTMQVGTDYPPESYLGQSGHFLMCLFADPGSVDPDVPQPLPGVEVVYDNAEVIEYYPPHLEISAVTNGVDLSWRLPMEEYIVVEADQLGGPWCPCSQPHTRTADAFCLNRPCQAPQKFFKLTPGKQFVDDFSSLAPTWTPVFQEAGEDWIVTNGVLRMMVTPTPLSGFGLMPFGTNAAAKLSDFCGSVDIVDWAPSGSNSSDFAFGGRARFASSTYIQAYIGYLTLNADGVVGKVRPWIHTPFGETYGLAFNLQQFPLPYRLQFSVVGPRISLKVLNPLTGQLIVPAVYASSTTLPDGFSGLWLQGAVNAGDSNSISVDNFIVSGTKP
jgi:hypothetical protein